MIDEGWMIDGWVYGWMTDRQMNAWAEKWVGVNMRG